ncbi:MAG TPA: XRE family transcriptional regulator [Lachnospiraceae bacterium]|nr:XRE family transcriptional regulator [Lachnospiraceae bacterium]
MKSGITNNARRIIAEKGLKQCAVAKMAGYTPQEFSDMLCGRRVIRANDIAAICMALEITPNDLFGCETRTKQ